MIVQYRIPEDNISKAGLYPRIGDYDLWAIRWGYGFIPGNTEEETKLASNKLITETLKANPRAWFGTYEGGNQQDPRSQSEDLSDNAVKASDYGVKLVNTFLAGLTARAVVILDEHDHVIYTELVSELANEPNYESAYAALQI